jgi:hypothetical protein
MPCRRFTSTFGSVRTSAASPATIAHGSARQACRDRVARRRAVERSQRTRCARISLPHRGRICVEWRAAGRAALPEVEREQLAIGGWAVGKLAQRGDLVVFGRHYRAAQRKVAREQIRGVPGFAIIEKQLWTTLSSDCECDLRADVRDLFVGNTRISSANDA